MSWLYKKYLKIVAKSAMIIKDLESRKMMDLDDLQKSIYDICIKLIHQEGTELRFSSMRYTYHIENPRFLIILKYSDTSSTICLMDNEKSGTQSSVFEIHMDKEHLDIISNTIDRELHRRMKNRESLKLTKIKSKLSSILDVI